MAKSKNTAIYKRNFLRNVILRLDFEQADISFLNEFIKGNSKDFPFAQQGSEGGFLLDTNENNFEKIEEKFWKISNPTQTKSIKITSKNIVLEYTSYKSSEDLFKTFSETLVPFIEKAQIKTINRLGLRYINYIDFKEVKKEGFSFSNYFNSKLLAVYDFATSTKSKVARQMSQIYLKKEDADISFNFGIWNNDFPNENTRNIFVMDFDCYSRFPIGNTEEEVRKLIKKYNAYIQELFEKSIKVEFRDFLNR